MTNDISGLLFACTSQNTDTITVVSAVICRIAAFQANNVLLHVRTICQVAPRDSIDDQGTMTPFKATF
jgi:hypothetical protein